MLATPTYQRSIRRWLGVCAVLVALMVLIGGLTRLTESGLSIVEWKLLSGTLPPLSRAAWQAEFEAYQATPQFKLVNHAFTLGDFQSIYWLEYLHRLLGRVIGLAVMLPLVYFAARRAFSPRLFRRMLGLLLLVGAQGTVGWIMVASGLVDAPRVAPIKLALHLLLAFGFFAALLVTRWQVGESDSTAQPAASVGLRVLAWLALAASVLQIGFGALVAGLRAGLSYNTYPLMDGALIPDGLHTLSPWWLNHVESVLTVQFQHRMGALLVVALVALLALRLRQISAHRRLAHALFLALFGQFTLGVVTLLSGVNLWLASLHQLGALVLFALLVRGVYGVSGNTALQKDCHPGLVPGSPETSSA